MKLFDRTDGLRYDKTTTYGFVTTKRLQLTLRSHRAAGHMRGEDAIVPCLIHSSSSFEAATRFLFPKRRGYFLAVQNVEQEM
jgi:hypothetical protein